MCQNFGSLRGVRSTNWNSFYRGICRALGSSHCSDFLAEFLLQAKCAAAENLIGIPAHLESSNEALTMLIGESCPIACEDVLKRFVEVSAIRARGASTGIGELAAILIPGRVKAVSGKSHYGV